jgi:hypothetical protein
MRGEQYACGSRSGLGTHLSCASTDSRASTTTTLLHGQVLLDRDIAVYYTLILKRYGPVHLAYQSAVLFSQNKPATSNQPAVIFSQNKPASAISHHPTEQADDFCIGQCVSYIEAI